MFKAVFLEKSGDRGMSARLAELDDSVLPADGDVRVQIAYSSLNYKDSLAVTGSSPVVRKWPMVPGIDGAGNVIDSSHPAWKPGDRVVITGWGVGEMHFGCLAQLASLKGDWLVALPNGLSARHAMAIGTAGFTAMLCVMELEGQGVVPKRGPVLVTGAAGGVGSMAVAILSRLGYDVTASTGRTHEAEYLHSLGAKDIIDRAELSSPGKPLQHERWAGVVDSVGSHTLANAIAQTMDGGTVTACGLAQGFDFPGTVMPFILRSVRLIGVNSVTVPLPRREMAWSRLATLLPADLLDTVATDIGLTEVIEQAPSVLAGQVRGRLVVDVDA
ncbi:MAG: oxidoreductase [Paucimonas sp.]|jgi:acrylyl-CoA reductase (NADPH)|nr:oxidoreductase [Paucimonas sp.]